MPIIVVLKNPPITLAVKGKIDQAYLQKCRVFDAVVEEAIDGMPMIIPIKLDSNIAYIKEISEEEYKELEAEKEKRKTQQGGQIVRPDVTMGPPGRGFRRQRGQH
jgi:hypothetical protein